MADLQEVRGILEENNQEQLLTFYDGLDTTEKIDLLKELKSINYSEVKRYFDACTSSVNDADIDANITPPPTSVIGSSTDGAETIEQYRQEGLQQVADGRVGIILMAGGQGSRLGFSHPKGMYDVGLPSGKTLFQLQGERIFALQLLAQKSSCSDASRPAVIPWYIMTSASTMKETRQYFADNNYFGLKECDVMFFEQHSLPCMTFEGRIILATPSSVAKAPDGNGGLYKALHSSGSVADMKSRGVKYLHAYCVDNILVKMADPVFMGFCVKRGASIGAKVVLKTRPDEPVGVVCKVKDHYRVVEYSEISKETSERTNEKGELTFSAGNIANHYFTTEFLERVVSVHENEMVHHIAKKKIAHVSLDCFPKIEQIKPTTPNGIKMEKFVFDVFQFARSDNDFAIWEVERESEFSPLKNADGETKVVKDSPTTSRLDLYNYHKKLIEKAGGICKECDQGKEFVCEISPMISYDGESLEEHVKGKVFESPLYLKNTLKLNE